MEKDFKRKYRELDDTTKKKISQSLTGQRKSFDHRQHISRGLTNYWKGVPSKNNCEIEDIMLDEEK